MKRVSYDTEQLQNTLTFQDLPVDIQNSILSYYPATLRQTPTLAKVFASQLSNKLCELEPTNDEIRRYLIDVKPKFFSYGNATFQSIYTLETMYDPPKWSLNIVGNSIDKDIYTIHKVHISSYVLNVQNLANAVGNQTMNIGKLRQVFSIDDIINKINTTKTRNSVKNPSLDIISTLRISFRRLSCHFDSTKVQKYKTILLDNLEEYRRLLLVSPIRYLDFIVRWSFWIRKFDLQPDPLVNIQTDKIHFKTHIDKNGQRVLDDVNDPNFLMISNAVNQLIPKLQSVVSNLEIFV